MSAPGVYLAGPITGSGNPALWRDNATRALFPEFAAVNPLHYEVASLTCRQIVNLDLALILRCEYVLALVNVPSWGTAMEIMFAREHAIPVIGFGILERNSPWLQYALDAHYNTMDTAIRHIREFNK